VSVLEIGLVGQGGVVVALDDICQAAGYEVVLDGVEPRRALGVAGAHVVSAAVGVAEEGGGHSCDLFT
jgi:hypothetical protein